jgi:ATP-dependent DNA helicase HFM1/MER3
VNDTRPNIVVSAPTSSGKTTIFELAFLRLMQDHDESRLEMDGNVGPLAVYIAPTKVSSWKHG